MTDHLGEQPRDFKPGGLGDAFAPPPERGAGLKDLGLGSPPPPPPSVTDPPPTADDPPADEDDKTAKQPQEPEGRQRTAANRSSRETPGDRSTSSASASVGAIQPRGIYLSGSVKDRLREYSKKRDDLGYSDILLDAIDDEQDRLGELFEGSPTGRRAGSLFAGRDRTRRQLTEYQSQVTFRLAKQDWKVVDGLIKKHRAGSRSAFADRVLDAYLPQLQPQPQDA